MMAAFFFWPRKDKFSFGKAAAGVMFFFIGCTKTIGRVGGFLVQRGRKPEKVSLVRVAKRTAFLESVNKKLLLLKTVHVFLSVFSGYKFQCHAPRS
ncbi:hypothetical protein [Rufibacter hautae]|uniref:Uncharacterized protein n=1 Tax=Rufibacter hautae TaxID=2595005 RepID=A0A5B6TBJ6_9BACT|nr:hypothetical protein [Rufibacter hautae]KAA3436349.1 hypothetical protein FOA19_18300 [Rufibacter hautae]